MNCIRPFIGSLCSSHGSSTSSSTQHAYGLASVSSKARRQVRRKTSTMCSSTSSGMTPISHDQSIVERVKTWLASTSKEREKITSLGSAFVISYGLVSNATYVSCLTIAWLSFVKTRGGQTPLDPGQWAPFLLYYAGLWAVQNFARPIRFALAAGLSPGFDRAMDWLALRLPNGWGKKAAFAILLATLAGVSFFCLFAGIYLGGGLPRGLGPLPPLSRL